MSSDEIAIRVQGLSKCYEIYNNPRDRLKQFVLPGLQRLIGQSPKQYFQEFWALKDVSFEVKKGETVGIIGRNGSGKSTLLQMICGTLTPTSGSIQTNGRVAALLELGSGFNPEFTGRENVYMNASVLGLSNEEIDTRFTNIVDFADIGDFIDQPVKTYSSGMMVRLAFAVIAHVDADILVVDEALSVGDAFFTQKCMRFLRNFMKTGTVLFVSHDTGSIKSLCNQAFWLEKGKVFFQGKSKNVCEMYLQAFYEEQQGAGCKIQIKTTEPQNPIRKVKDQREQFINSSNFRNDIQVFDFNPDSASFGTGQAEITDVWLTNSFGEMLSWIVGGEEVTLSIQCKVNKFLYSPIVGFYVKDRLGQTLFGDNTYLSYLNENINTNFGENLVAQFIFYMPFLPKGNYSIAVGLANGSQDAHTMEIWMHDAVMFHSENQRSAVGLIGVPMHGIYLHNVNSIKEE